MPDNNLQSIYEVKSILESGEISTTPISGLAKAFGVQRMTGVVKHGMLIINIFTDIPELYLEVSQLSGDNLWQLKFDSAPRDLPYIYSDRYDLIEKFIKNIYEELIKHVPSVPYAPMAFQLGLEDFICQVYEQKYDIDKLSQDEFIRTLYLKIKRHREKFKDPYHQDTYDVWYVNGHMLYRSCWKEVFWIDNEWPSKENGPRIDLDINKKLWIVRPAIHIEPYNIPYEENESMIKILQILPMRLRIQFIRSMIAVTEIKNNY